MRSTETCTSRGDGKIKDWQPELTWISQMLGHKLAFQVLQR
jgi:hypothetical protein